MHSAGRTPEPIIDTIMTDAPGNIPLVSVIVTCHNQASVIEQTLRSVLNQTLRQLECIVVNDGSTDGGEIVVQNLAALDSRIRLINQQNSGVSFARNIGFASATGEFIQFLDGDDLLDPTKLEKQVEHLRREPTVGVSWTYHRFCNADATSFSSYIFKTINEFPLDQFLFGWHDGISLPLHAPLYRRSLWSMAEMPYPPDYTDRCEDWVFLVVIALNGAKFSLLPETLCTYRMSNDGFTRNSRELKVAYLVAAAWLQDRIPVEYRSLFFKEAVRRSLTQYVDEMKPEILYASWNWRLGNCLTKPFATLFRVTCRVTAQNAQHLK